MNFKTLPAPWGRYEAGPGADQSGGGRADPEVGSFVHSCRVYNAHFPGIGRNATASPRLALVLLR